MQKIITLSFLIAVTFALCGCVNRTVSKESGNRGHGTHGAKNDSGKVISEKRIWIWQDEFRNH